jgi:hypothetical protein
MQKIREIRILAPIHKKHVVERKTREGNSKLKRLKFMPRNLDIKKNADQEFISAYECGSLIIISHIQGVRAYGDSSNEHLLVKIEGENRQQHFV